MLRRNTQRWGELLRKVCLPPLATAIIKADFTRLERLIMDTRVELTTIKALIVARFDLIESSIEMADYQQLQREEATHVRKDAWH